MAAGVRTAWSPDPLATATELFVGPRYPSKGRSDGRYAFVRAYADNIALLGLGDACGGTTGRPWTADFGWTDVLVLVLARGGVVGLDPKPRAMRE